VIRSFKDRESARIWAGERSPVLPASIQNAALRKFRLLNQAKRIADLRVPPGNRLEPLRGERLGQYSIRINRQWRICFEWRDGNADAVEIVDYHR
jgi:proteic killer suppression protein